MYGAMSTSKIQGNKCTTDFYIIDLHGVDAVLGVAWQEGFGELKVNYQQSYIKFVHEGKEVTSHGKQDSTEIESISANALHQLLRKDEIAQCYIMQLVQVPTGNENLASLHSIQPIPVSFHTRDK